MAIFTDFSSKSILDSNKNQQTKGKSYWGNYRVTRDHPLNFTCRSGKQPLHTEKQLSSFDFLQKYAEGEKHFFSHARMCKTHWFSTKLSTEDKGISGVLTLQSKHWVIGLAPSVFSDSRHCVPADNIIIINFITTFGISLDASQPIVETLQSVSFSHTLRGYLLNSSIT